MGMPYQVEELVAFQQYFSYIVRVSVIGGGNWPSFSVIS
jgi:hypothetical protein